MTRAPTTTPWKSSGAGGRTCSNSRRRCPPSPRFPCSCSGARRIRSSPPRSGLLLRECFRDAEYVVLPHVGHLPYEEAPEEFNRLRAGASWSPERSPPTDSARRGSAEQCHNELMSLRQQFEELLRSVERGAWVRFLIAIFGLALAFASALLSTASREAGDHLPRPSSPPRLCCWRE